jgi:hypothetical protein
MPESHRVVLVPERHLAAVEAYLRDLDRLDETEPIETKEVLRVAADGHEHFVDVSSEGPTED